MPLVKREWVDEIIFVDGGSTDGTIEEAKRMGFKVIIQKQKGHGAAVLEGVNAIKSDNFILFGPDGNDEPEKIPELVEKINEGYDQVLATRFGKGSVNLDAGIIDTFGNKMFTFLANVFFGGYWTDTLNESRIISKKAFQELNFDAMDLSSTQQMSIRGLKRRQKICEILGNEGERIGGVRKMKPLPVGASLSLRIIKEFIHWK